MRGIFAPMYNENGEIELNQWGEIKFIAPEGAHRCRIQVERWLADPKLALNHIACYGNWKPRLNHTTEAGQKEILEIGKKYLILFLYSNSIKL